MVTRSTVGSLLRAAQAFCSQLCEKETLPFGIVYRCSQFPQLAEVNQFREVYLANPDQLPVAMEQADQSFRSRGLKCRRWAPAGGAPSPEMEAFLNERGYASIRYAALAACRWVDWTEIADVRVVPARALRTKYRDTFLSERPAGSSPDPGALAEAYGERLDDPSYDAVVALMGQVPVGRCALHQVGDIAHVQDLTVLSDFEGRGVERALLGHVLAMAKRLAMRMICTQINVGDPRRIEWFQQAGFEWDGTLVEFEREP